MRPSFRERGLRFVVLLALLVLFGCQSTIGTGGGGAPTATAGDQGRGDGGGSLALDARIPVDPRVRVGVLKNGLRFYVRENRRPENRAELRLVVNAGSILEDEDQLGLAHFVEHMAFNGTAHFEKQELVEYLESIGLRFGPDLNAYTGFDETVYLLQVPTDRPEIVATAFQILEDWAHAVSFDDEEIEKERGVVIEEWRSGRGAGARIQDQQFPVLFKDSLYAKRLPIGKKETLESFSPEVLRRFYRDWYRPDLMAVVAVGDFEARRIERLIRRHFSRLEAQNEPRPRPEPAVPNHSETLVSIATDPELTQTGISVAYKYDPTPTDTVGQYRRSLVESLYHRMVNDRLSERAREAEPPFLGAFSSQGRFVRSKEAYVLSAGVEDGGLERGLEAILQEGERARRHGFADTELGRQKADYLRAVARAYEEREKTESAAYAREYVGNFLSGEPIAGIEYEFRLTQAHLSGIEVDEVNAVARGWITDENRVILVSGPRKEEVVLPAEEELLAVFERVATGDVEPYVDRVRDLPLLADLPAAGSIVSRRRIEELGVSEWELSNGIRVVLKPTDFKNDQVLFSSFSPGGHSLVEDEEHVAALTATAVVQQGGVGEFDLVELQKLLSGKVVRVSPFIGELSEGLSGAASPDDLETMFQLIHLYLTAPRKDETAFQSYQHRMRGALANRGARPETHFEDALQLIMSQNHYRRRPFTVDLLSEMDLETSYRIYRDRFFDTSDFVFFFVGSFDVEALEPLVLTYLATLPDRDRVESFRDVEVDPPGGVVEETVSKGLEPKSRVRILFTGPFEWSRVNRYHLQSVASLLRIKLRESLREDMGGTYGVAVTAATSEFPEREYAFSISFGCAPENVEELTTAVFTEIRRLKEGEVDAADLAKIQETQRRGRETDLKTNGFWLSTLRYAYYHGEDPRHILAFDELVGNLTAEAVVETARRYLREERYVKVVLLPQPEAQLVE